MCWSVFRHDRYSIKVCCCVVDIGTKQQPMHVLVSVGQCWSVFRHDRYSIKVCCCVVDIGTKQQPMHVLVSV